MSRISFLVLGITLSSFALAEMPTPDEILRGQNLAQIRAALKAEAKPTMEHHEALLAVLERAESFDTARVHLILDGCYDFNSDIQKLRLLIKQKKADGEFEAAERLRAPLVELLNGGSVVNRIVAEGMHKASDLTAEKGVELLNRLVPHAVMADAAFRVYLEKFPSATQEQRAHLLDLAIRIGADFSAGHLALAWYKAEKDYTVAGALNLAARLNRAGKDILLSGAVSLLPSIELKDLVTISKTAYSSSSEIILAGANKVPQMTPDKIVTLASLLSYGYKDTLIKRQMERISSFTTAEILTLARAAYSESSTIILNYVDRISDHNLENAMKLAANVSYGNKDRAVKNYLASKDSFTTQEILSLARSAYSESSDVILQNVDRVSDLSVPSALKLSAALSYGNKDTLLKRYLEQQDSVSASDLIAIAGAAYSESASMILGNLFKVSDYSAANAVRLMGNVSYGNKDRVAMHFLDQQKKITTDEMIQLTRAAYSESATIILQHMRKVSDLNFDNAVRLMSLLSYGNKDRFANSFMSWQNSCSTSDMIKIARASYTDSADVILHSISKISDLTVENAVLTASLLSYGRKDTYLLQVVKRVQNLNAGNLALLVNAAYSESKQVEAIGRRRLGL